MWTTLLLTPSGTSVGDRTADLTPSGKSVGSRGMSPLWLSGPFSLPQLTPWPFPGWQTQKPPVLIRTAPDTNKEDPKVTKNAALSPSAIEDEVVIQLSDTEAHEFPDFDPTIEPKGTWEPPGQ